MRVYLKRVEIQGFKSFAGRSVFEFGPGITAVVGPNGSGKSNLADALRWVLGEQNPRALRSRRSDEVIFAGGRQRPPAGFAEVSVTFDNSDGWLPLEFDEVVLTRRLHRSGESEYLLNRARVRLKDLTDILSRGRVGQNSYAIMGQGLVDQVLNLHPDERRALIEEAADVRRHRVRIVDAVERLDTTRENLDRVGLLVGELAPRVAQLEAQARRAAEHGALTRELAETLQAHYGLQWLDRSEALASARTEYERRSSEMVAAQAEVERIERELHATRAELQRVREGAATGEASVRELDDRQRRAEQQRDLAQERAALLERRVAEIAADLEALQRERAELEAESQEESEDAAGEGAVAAELAGREAELREADLRLSQARRGLAETEDALRLARGQAVAVDDRAGRAQRGLRALEREREEAIGRRNGLLARLRKYGGDALRLANEYAASDDDLQAREKELSAARRQARLGREQAERAERELQAAARECDAVRTRLELLTRLREEHRGGDGAVRALVDASSRNGADVPPRLLATLTDVLRVQKGIETAIEAALDEQLDAVIVPGAIDVQAALRILVERRSGRATIVPLDDLKPAHALNLSNERGVLGVAARFVKCDGRYRELVDTLLGRVIVVEDLATAQTVVRRGLGVVVTLDGTVVRPSGIVTGGRGGASGLLLQFERELEELPARAAALRAVQAEHQQEASRARDQAQQADVRLREIETRIDANQSRRRQIVDAAGSVRAAIAGTRGEAAWLRGATAVYGERRAALEAELAACEEERRREAQGVRSAQLVVESARREVESLRAPADGLRARLAAAEGALQLHEQRRQALARLREGRRAARERLERTIAARSAEAEERRAEMEALLVRFQALEGELSGLERGLAEQRGRLQPLRSRLAQLSRDERELFERYTVRRSELLNLERAAMEAESTVSRRAQAIERLRDELEADGVELPEELLAAEPAEARRLLAIGGSEPLPGDAVATSGRSVQERIGQLHGRVRTLRTRIRQIGPVNAEAERDYLETKERHDFLTSQIADLQQAEGSLQEALEELRRVVRERFRETFHSVNADFARYFKTFFGGGTARLALTEPEDFGESGVDVLAQPPGKRQQHLQLLSGGERSMTAVALLFALLETNPAPFCVLDEVDAALDEANVGRFGEALRELAERTQFVLITHNRSTIQAADSIYGIAMGGDGVSSILSLRLEDVPVGA